MDTQSVYQAAPHTRGKVPVERLPEGLLLGGIFLRRYLLEIYLKMHKY